jgi:hypothetical protein
LLILLFELSFVAQVSCSQKADSVSPIPFCSFAPQVPQRSPEASYIRRWYGFFIHKYYAAVGPAFFRPGLEQQRNRPTIIRNKRQAVQRGLLQTAGVWLPEKFSVFPLGHRNNGQPAISPAKITCYRWRDVLVQKELEHLSSLCQM